MAMRTRASLFLFVVLVRAGVACTGEGRPAPSAPHDPANPRAQETPFDAGPNPLRRGSVAAPGSRE